MLDKTDYALISAIALIHSRLLEMETEDSTLKESFNEIKAMGESVASSFVYSAIKYGKDYKDSILFQLNDTACDKIRAMLDNINKEIDKLEESGV